MLVTTSDGSFGFSVESTESLGFFMFQLMMNGQLLGDREPCILGTAMQQLQNLAIVNLDAFPSNEAPASAIRARLQANEDWYDATLLPLAESFDAWQLRGFTNGSTVTFLAQKKGGAADQPTSPFVASIPVAEYDALVAAIVKFWTAERGGQA